MTLPSSGSYDEPVFIAPAGEAAGPLKIQLPTAWWPAVRGASLLLFAILWMMESWEKAGPLKGPTKANSLTQDLAALLMVLLGAYAIHGFWKHRAPTLAPVLGLAVAAAAMALHHM